MAATIEHAAARMRRYGIGIDCHSRFVVVVVLVPSTTKDELIRYEESFPLLMPELRRAKEWVLARLLDHGIVANPLIYTLESTACYHYPVMRTWAGTPCVINPTLAASFKARKTDIQHETGTPEMVDVVYQGDVVEPLAIGAEGAWPVWVHTYSRKSGAICAQITMLRRQRKGEF
jgi:hypothetical protein